MPILLSKIIALSLAGTGAPIGASWAYFQEQKILQHGQALPEHLITWAREKGIQAPEKVRILHAKVIPLPAPMPARRLLGKLGYPTDRVAGLCLRYGIYLQDAIPLDSQVLRHELIHTRQYEQDKSLYGFLYHYLYQTIFYGYSQAPYEREADADAL